MLLQGVFPLLKGHYQLLLLLRSLLSEHVKPVLCLKLENLLVGQFRHCHGFLVPLLGSEVAALPLLEPEELVFDNLELSATLCNFFLLSQTIENSLSSRTLL